jgi:hypothetical protein
MPIWVRLSKVKGGYDHDCYQCFHILLSLASHTEEGTYHGDSEERWREFEEIPGKESRSNFRHSIIGVGQEHGIERDRVSESVKGIRVRVASKLVG